MTQLRVLYWNNMPSPYFVGRFNAIARRGDLAFTAWFSSWRERGRSWTVHEDSFQFEYRYVGQYRHSSRRYYLGVPMEIFSRDFDLIVTGIDQPSWLGGWQVARARGWATCFRILPPSEAWFPRSRSRERMKRVLLPKATGFEVSGPEAIRYLQQYGVSSDRCFETRQGFDVKMFSSASSQRQWEMQKFTFVYVGRLWEKKGVYDLLDAFARLRVGDGLDVALKLVGDGPDEEGLRSIVDLRNIPDVELAGFKEGRDLVSQLAESHCFVFPTWGDPYGLALREAMASGLPVISTDAAGEVEQHVRSGESGIVVDARAPRELYSAMKSVATNPRWAETMGREAARSVAGHTFEAYAEDFSRLAHRLAGRRR